MTPQPRRSRFPASLFALCELVAMLGALAFVLGVSYVGYWMLFG